MYRRYILASLLPLTLAIVSFPKLAYAQTMENNSMENDYVQSSEQVLKQDKQNSARLNSEIKTQGDDAIKNYVSATSRIDLRGCPTDFQDAFLRHRDAWSRRAYLSAPAQYQGFLGKVNALLDGLSGNSSKIYEIADQQVKQSFSEIQDTWREVELIALRHGPDVTQ